MAKMIERAIRASPAQTLDSVLGQQTRTRLPTTNELLTTSESPAVRKSLEQATERQAGYYNAGAKDRSPLTTGQTVSVKLDYNSEWRNGEIERVLPYRS